MRYQRTLRTSAQCRGIGLHSGKPVMLTLKPAPVDSGIRFVRTDLGGRLIVATAASIGNTSYATTLCSDGICVGTVEHLLSALAGLNIDNVLIEIDADEVPIMDGSAGPFIRMIAEAGVAVQDKDRSLIKILKPIFVRDGNKQLAVWPAQSPSISCFIDFDHPLLREQSLHYTISEGAYLREVADARTFGFVSEVQALRARGLAKGASLENAIGLDKDSVLNRDGLRYSDEFVRHKVLDLIGDLALIGMPVIGHFVAHKSGHALNARMVSKILNTPQNWIPIGAEEKRVFRHPVVQLQHAPM